MKHKRKPALFTSARNLLASLALVLVTASVPAIVSAEEATKAPAAELQWIDGAGQPIPMGNISTLTLKEGYSFLDGANTKSYITQYGGLPSDTEIGAIFPIAEEDNWAVYFEYEEPDISMT